MHQESGLLQLLEMLAMLSLCSRSLSLHHESGLLRLPEKAFKIVEFVPLRLQFLF